jgi:hypothetical protein
MNSLLRKCVVAAVLAAAVASFATPSMARIHHWRHHYLDFYGTPGAPGARWNPVPPVGHASRGAAARHDNCPTGTYECY